jgi:hypothetical protein
MLGSDPAIGVWATVSVRRRRKPAVYPNGRALTDDVFSARFAWLTRGKVTADGLKPHDDLLSEFPYLGPPNVYPA